MIDACNGASGTTSDFSYEEPSPTNATEPDTSAAIDDIIAAFGKNAVSESTTPSYAAALAGLRDNYAQIPKDNNGYVAAEGLQQMIDNPDAFAADAVEAAHYVLDPANIDQVNALDSSRERYAEGKINIDGEISKEDIESELAHLDDQKDAEADLESATGMEPQTAEMSQDDMDATAQETGLDTGETVVSEDETQAECEAAAGAQYQSPMPTADLAEDPQSDDASGDGWTSTSITMA